MIAGLAKAPTLYSPIHRQKLAIERRNTVLDKMATYGLATAEEVAAAKQEPIKLNLYRDVFPDRMPYYAEHVRRYVNDTYGNDALFSQGLRIETAGEPTWEAPAYENADFGARHQDKRQGWRGPEWRVDGPARDLFIARQKQLYGDAPLIKGKRYLAVVDKVTSEKAVVMIGDRRFELPLRDMKWASKWQAGNADNDVEIDSVSQALKPGYVVWVTREVRTLQRYRDWNLPDTKNPSWVPSDDQHDWDDAHADIVKLEQVPHPQSSIFTADHHTGYVVAMVGGFDYDRSVFNRTVQACRQPGSTYKPIYYSLGLNEGYGFDTVLNDVPVKIVDPDTGEEWSPTNLGETMDGDVTLEYALVFSKNIPSVDLFQRLGAKNVEAWARRLGFSTKIFADDALALGASCSRLDEMARAFTMFARMGQWWPRPAGKEKNWVYVRRILDRDGNTVEDNTVAEDPAARRGRSLRSHRRPRRDHAAPGDPDAPRVPDEQAPRLRGRVRLRERPPRDPAPGRGQDRHVERHPRQPVHRLHLEVHHPGVDGRRQEGARARQERRRVHDGGPAVGALHVREREELPEPEDPVVHAARHETQRSRRPQQGRPRPADGPDLPGAEEVRRQGRRRSPPAGLRTQPARAPC